MRTAIVFKCGNSQAVKLPAEFRNDADVMEIYRRGDELVLGEKAKSLGQFFYLLASLPSDFMVEREDIQAQVRGGEIDG